MIGLLFGLPFDVCGLTKKANIVDQLCEFLTSKNLILKKEDHNYAVTLPALLVAVSSTYVMVYPLHVSHI